MPVLSLAVGNRPVREILLEHLEYLKHEDLILFKWYLTEDDAAFQKTPECKLEKAVRCDIVTCMIKQHGVDGAAELTMTILRKMQKNNDAEQLQKKLDIKGNDEFSVRKMNFYSRNQNSF